MRPRSEGDGAELLPRVMESAIRKPNGRRLFASTWLGMSEKWIAEILARVKTTLRRSYSAATQAT